MWIEHFMLHRSNAHYLLLFPREIELNIGVRLIPVPRDVIPPLSMEVERLLLLSELPRRAELTRYRCGIDETKRFQGEW